MARTPKAVVAVTDASAYPTGFELVVSVRAAASADDETDDLFLHPNRYRLPRDASGALPAELFRFGIEFADGRKATTLEWDRGGSLAQPPTGPILATQGGGGDHRRWDQRYWIWPLPPPGRVAFVCEWPALGVALSRAEVDASPFLEAAGRAETLWEDPG